MEDGMAENETASFSKDPGTESWRNGSYSASYLVA